jgi:hypothetical protein
MAMPELRPKILCVGRPDCIRQVRALRHVRQYGSAADFTRAWRGLVRMAISPASLSHLSLRSLPQPLLFDPILPAHHTDPGRSGTKNSIAFDFKLAMMPGGKTFGAGRRKSPHE